MSKKIRVAWEDLKPGDLIHVKGSTNTYKFVSYGSGTISGDPEKVTPKKAKQYAFVDIQAAAVHPCGRCFYTELNLVVLDSDFDYATRPAPKKPRIEEPVSLGEHWARIKWVRGPFGARSSNGMLPARRVGWMKTRPRHRIKRLGVRPLRSTLTRG